MGKQVGDEIIISLPEQKVEYEVIRVTTIHEDSEEDEE